MAISVDAFIVHLSTSGVLSEHEVADALREVPQQARPQDGPSLGKLLVERGLLTPYQADNIGKGRTSGWVLGDYVILDSLTQGGMAMVYKAQHRRLKRIVVLKALPPQSMNSPELVGRFQREVIALGNLQHRNIVAALDARQSQGIHYLIMEFIEGTDLWRLVQKKGPLPIEMTVDIARQSCEGLAYAHRQGIIHRDIKPQNLIFAVDGVVKILDMGLARLLDTDDQRLTQTGFMLGTVAFMAPEQARSSKDVTHSTDIYALGCTLYYLLTGKAPYGLEHNAETIFAHRKNPIPYVRDLREDCPPRLDDIVRRMLGKEPGDRFATLDEVIPLLDDCLDTSSHHTPLGQAANSPVSGPSSPVRALEPPPQTRSPGSPGSSRNSGARRKPDRPGSRSTSRNGRSSGGRSGPGGIQWAWIVAGLGIAVAAATLVWHFVWGPPR